MAVRHIHQELKDGTLLLELGEVKFFWSGGFVTSDQEAVMTWEEFVEMCSWIPIEDGGVVRHY